VVSDQIGVVVLPIAPAISGPMKEELKMFITFPTEYVYKSFEKNILLSEGYIYVNISYILYINHIKYTCEHTNSW